MADDSPSRLFPPSTLSPSSKSDITANLLTSIEATTGQTPHFQERHTHLFHTPLTAARILMPARTTEQQTDNTDKTVDVDKDVDPNLSSTKKAMDATKDVDPHSLRTSDKSAQINIDNNSASSPQKKTLKHTRKMAPNTDTKGDPAEVKSFLDAHTSEPKYAAYLGYKDLAEYRKFLLSHHFLKFYIFYAKNFARRTGSKSTKVALEILRDLRDAETNFPANLEHTVNKYPIISVEKGKHAAKDNHDKIKQNEKHTNYLLATILYRAAEYFDDPEALSPEARDLAQAHSIHDLADLYPNLTIPQQFDLDTLQLPKIGPHTDMGEDLLEKYNRVHNMLRSLGHNLVVSRWRDKWMKANPFSPQTIDESSVPLWMVLGKASKDDNAPKPKAPPSLPRKVMTLEWDRQTKTKSSAALEEHINGFVTEQILSVPSITQPCVRDPRVYPFGSMWRDTLRRQLFLQDLRLEFVAIRLHCTSIDGHTQELVLLAPHGTVSDWEIIRDALRQNDLEAKFIYTLKPLDEGEDFEFEYQGPPLALHNDLCLGADNDVEIRQQEVFL